MRRSLVFPAVSLLAFSVTFAALAAASSGAAAEQGDLEPEPTASADSWFVQIGEELGISPEEAEIMHGWAGPFNDALAQVRAAYPDSYAWGEMNPGGVLGAEVAFTGVPPTDAASYFAQLPVEVSILGGAPIAEATAAEAVPAAHYAARRALAAITGSHNGLSSGYDRESGIVTVNLLGKRPVDVTALVTRMQSRAAEAVAVLPVRRGAKAPVVRVVVRPQGRVFDDAVSGGAALSSCTSGFSVIDKSTSVRGIITADHCPRTQYYAGRNVLTYRRSLASSRGDIAFYQSSETVVPKFWFSPFAQYTVTQHPMPPALDQYLCKFGKTTMSTCDYVHSFANCRNSYCGLVNMSNRKADGGDSGGPWHYGDRAVGVHSGGDCQVVCRDQFSMLNENLGTYLNVNLLF